MHHADRPVEHWSQRERGHAADHADQRRIEATDFDPAGYSERSTDRNRVPQFGDRSSGRFAATSALSPANRLAWEDNTSEVHLAQENTDLGTKSRRDNKGTETGVFTTRPRRPQRYKGSAPSR